MKKIIPLLFVSTLVSCVDTLPTRSTIPRQVKEVTNLESNSSLKPRLIIRTQKSGSTMNPVVVNTDKSLKHHDINSEVIAVVLKIEKNKYYEYQEIHDYISGKVTKQVLLQFIPTKQTYADAIVNNKVARLTGYAKSTLRPSETISVKFKQDLIKEVSLEYIMCDITLDNEETVVIFENNNQVGSDFASSSEKTTCDGLLSKDEFQNLDLTSIQFCDKTSSDAGCGLFNLNKLKK